MNCKICNKEFQSINPNQLCCSPDCTDENRKIKIREWGERNKGKRSEYNKQFKRKGRPTEPYNCVICGNQFQPQTRNHKTCSVQCSRENVKNIKTEFAKRDNKPITEIPCAICGTVFLPKQSNYKCCSKPCSRKYGISIRVKWEFDQRNSDLQFRIKHSLRNRFKAALRQQKTKKSDTLFNLTGCSYEEFIQHIESQFQEGMSWDNYGKDGWHIDHIKPCASFDLTDPQQQKLCFHFTNLQPLWAEDNLKKGSKYVHCD